MNKLRLIIAACLVLLSAPLCAQEWASYATISAEPTPGRICTGNANGKDILCASPAPYVDASGNVGIGTLSPISPLDVYNAGSPTITVSNASQQWGIQTRSDMSNSFNIRNMNMPYNALTINTSNFVGIGTNQPTVKLDVVGTMRVADSGDTCSVAADKGKFRYNTSTGKFQICR